MRKIFRKCNLCKELIDIKGDKDKLIIVNGVYYHIDCFIQSKMAQKRKWSLEKCQQYISDHADNTENEVNQILDEINQIKEIKVNKEKEKSLRLQITDWIYKAYNVNFLPKYFFTKLDTVYKGTYKNLKTPIPVEDLFDMWKQRINDFDKIAENNRKKGKEMSGVNRINYDLAILVGKYDSYLSWKEKQKLAQADIKKTIAEKVNINYNNIKPTDNERTKENKNLDINDILDEI